jgi:hypothetical protein
VAILYSNGRFYKKLMHVSVLVGLQNKSVSIEDGCRIRNGFNKFICLLYSCVGLNVMSLCIQFILAGKRGVSFYNHIQLNIIYLKNAELTFWCRDDALYVYPDSTARIFLQLCSWLVIHCYTLFWLVYLSYKHEIILWKD